MAERIKRCKRCQSKPSLTEDDISEMVRRVTEMKGARLADDELYEKRIALCRACDKLEYGTTCMLCGCVMQVRARLADGKCPKKNGWAF